LLEVIVPVAWPRHLSSLLVAIGVLSILLFFGDRRSAAAQLPPDVDQPDYWLEEFARLNANYQAFWDRPVDGANDAYARSDGSIVAWVDTRYALQAYLDLYAWSKDTKYLDWFVTRLNTLITYRRDVDGDGTYSWATAKYWTSLIGNGGFERKTEKWPALTEQQLLTSTLTTGLLVVPRPPDKCTANLPSTFLGSYYASLRPGSSLQQSYLSPATSRFYRLRFDANLPPGDRLRVALHGEEGPLLTVVLEHLAVSGPEGWQRFAQDFAVSRSQTVSLTLEAPDGNLDAVQLDNIVLTPYLDMFTGDMQMASLLANFALLVDEHPQLSAYRQYVGEYQALAEEIVAKYQANWRELDDQRAVYMVSEAEPYNHPYNHVAPAGEALLMLSKLNSGEKAQGYLRQAVMLANTMRSQMRANTRVPDALTWNYTDELLAPQPGYIPRVEDTTHAGNSVPFLRLMHDAGYVFSGDDLRQVANALAGIWNGSYTTPLFFDMIDERRDILPSGQFPFVRHVSLTTHEQLQQASMVGWLSRARKVQCIHDAETMANGWIMSLPAAMLRYRFAQRDTADLTIVVEARAAAPAPLRFAGDLGEFTVEDTSEPLGHYERGFVVKPGVYHISQLVPERWVLVGVRCSLTGGAATRVEQQGVRVAVAAGDDVTCIFNNEYAHQLLYFPFVAP
jgi:hypothetical protein